MPLPPPARRRVVSVSREPRQTASEETQEGLRFKKVALDGETEVGIIEHPNRRSEWIESTVFVDVQR